MHGRQIKCLIEKEQLRILRLHLTFIDIVLQPLIVAREFRDLILFHPLDLLITLPCLSKVILDMTLIDTHFILDRCSMIERQVDNKAGKHK